MFIHRASENLTQATMALQTRATFQAATHTKIFTSSLFSEPTCYIHLPFPKNTNFITLSTNFLYSPLHPRTASSSNKSYQETVSDDEDQQQQQDSEVMTEEERKEWRRKIREVIDNSSEVDQVTDPIEKKKRMDELLSEYPLVVDEEDPNWPDHADGWGFNLGQFFDKITIKNVRKDDEDDENYDSDKEIVWQDDDYIRPIKEIKTAEWEETVFKDISPLVVFVHNRYKRPKENENMREELEKVAHIFWNCGLPSPRCVAVDAVVEDELAAVLNVGVFPEVLFTKAGKILYREKGFRSADELSKIMGFFYYGAARPECLSGVEAGNEMIPSAPANSV